MTALYPIPRTTEARYNEARLYAYNMSLLMIYIVTYVMFTNSKHSVPQADVSLEV